MILEKSTLPVAVISGAFGYVGKEVSMRLAKEGFTLALFYNTTNPEDVTEVLSSLPGSGHRAYSCDLTSYANVEATFAKIEVELGLPSLIVHAAGLKPTRKKLYLTDSQSFHIQIEQNVFGSFNFLTIAAKALKNSPDGVLVGITTIGVLKKEATKSLGGYIPAKFAIQGMLTMLQDELAPSVRVYSIAPGFMENGMNKEVPRAFVEMLKSKNKTHSLATGESIASLIVELYNKTSVHTETFLIPLAPEFDL